MISKKILSALVFAGSALMLAGSVSANTLSIDEVSGPIGGSVSVDWSFEPSDPPIAAGVEWCLTFDDSSVDIIDDSECVAGAPDGFDGPFTNCDSTPGCPGATLTINASDFDSFLPSMPTAGTLVFSIDSGVNAGDSFELVGECIELNAPISESPDSADCPDLAVNNGSIEAVEVTEESVLNVQPDNIDFGGVQTGETSGPETVTVSNDGDDGVDLEITGIDISGDFNVDGGTCSVGTELADGETCTIDVTFSPSADGPASGALTVDSDADVVTNDTVALSGEGTEAPPPEPADLSVNPPSGDVSLGTGNPGDVLDDATATISNAGEEDGDFDCTLDDQSGVFGASPLSGTVPGEGQASIELSCSLPTDAEDGDSFAAVFSCTGDEGFESEHNLSCSVSEFDPVPVPTMQKWSLILFALMMLIAGGIGVRFFRT